jgi:hypothetical protein
LEFTFRDCEFVTPAGELWHWRRAFLKAIEDHATQALLDLASFLPTRHDLVDARRHFDEYTKDDQDTVQKVEWQLVFFDLHKWLHKYGFNRGRLVVARVAKRKGITTPKQLAEKTQLPFETCKQIWTEEPLLPSVRATKDVCGRLSKALDIMPHRLIKPDLLHFWGWIVALDTLQYWDEEDSSATGKRFVSIGRDVQKREVLLAHPQPMTAPLSGITPKEQTQWENERRKYREAATKGELILPPESFDTWAPFQQTRDDYLKSQKRNLICLLEKGDRRLADDYRKLLDSYCNRLETHYKQNGYKKLTSNRQNAEQQILWTVQAHVLNNPYGSVTDLSGAPVQIADQGVKARIAEVLEKLDLAPRQDRKGDRKSCPNPTS